MNDEIVDQPDGATPLDDISGLLRDDITTRGQLDEAESLNIVGAVDWINRGRFDDVFVVPFYKNLHARMYNQVWSWAGVLRSETGSRPNLGVPPERVIVELGRVAMEAAGKWESHEAPNLLEFVAWYHHALVLVHPFNNGNGRWSRLACDVVIEKIAKVPEIIWARDTLTKDSEERTAYIAALKLADAGNLQQLVDYLAAQNPGR